ncbi:hypothetical protein PSHI8_07090 [Polynucleobacter sp. SHI8]|uniref:TAXI family TRAP transporter solute-binding subunit n=1 Tax=unclassified Polynucleobacter TaxID=2640945 RepID=UPI0024907EC3|nr:MULTISPECIES: TAXI family TRAP transporter solute-binding subunit [unclassified Polynucleobacter]BDW10627.1 hypothetical protein PSHI2_07090 [Polynucleobacter sp. SHI2]BDW13073.1 hypothetical protein PSHI8_07090 [Polynucleobacter sp. SHI8]
MKSKSYFFEIVAEELKTIKEIVLEQKFLTFIFIAALIMVVIYLEPTPPKKIRVAGYISLVEPIKEYFEKEGFEVESLSTEGSIQNAELLAADHSNVDVAFIQGGSISKELASKIQSLGSVAYEPVWIFYQKSLGKEINTLKDLSKLRVGVGPEKGGTRPLVKELFLLEGISIEKNQHFIVDSYDNNNRDFQEGKLDAIIVVTPFLSPDIQKLLREPQVKLFNFDLASAYVKKIPHIEEVTIPKGSIEIEGMIPPRDVKLIATTTSLAIRKDFNKDLQFLMLIAMKNLNRNPDMMFFSKRQEFPAYMDATIEASQVALKFYDYGIPEIMRYFPHSIAGFANRFWVLMLSFATIIYTLTKFNVRLSAIRYRMKLREGYRKLLQIEKKVYVNKLQEEDYKKLIFEIDQLNLEISNEKVPFGFEQEYFQFMLASKLYENKIRNLP